MKSLGLLTIWPDKHVQWFVPAIGKSGKSGRSPKRAGAGADWRAPSFVGQQHGAYLAWAPQQGMAAALGNCVSSLRDAGWPIAVVASKLVWLVELAMQLHATGIALK